MSQLTSVLTLLTFLVKGLFNLRHLPSPVLAGFEGLLEIHGMELCLVVGLALGQSATVRAYDGADSRVTAAGHGVVHQHDRLDPARHLDRTDRVAEVDHICLIRPSPRRLLAFDEL